MARTVFASVGVALLVLIIGPTTVVSQDKPTEAAKEKALKLPDCDIFLFDLKMDAGELKISNGRNITNRPGYDNQPWFTPDSGSILYSANGQPNRTDIYEYFIKSGETRQVTDSSDQEYSPQISPDNKTLSFVTDGPTANQSVWLLGRDQEQPKWLLANQSEREPVGYYSWNHKTDDILFWSRYGYSIRLVHRTKDTSHYVCGNAVPASPYVIPGTNNFSFVHRQANGTVWIKELNPQTLAVRPLVEMPGSNANYGWVASGKILNIDGSELKQWSTSSKDEWKTIANLKELSIEKATRVAASPNGKHLAIVGLPMK